MRSLFTSGMVFILFSCIAVGQSTESTQLSGSPGTSPQPAQSTAAQGSATAESPGGSTSANAGGAVVGAVLDKTVDAKKAKEGDQVIAKTLQDLKAPDGQVIPRNSKLIGHVTQVQARGKGQDQSTLGIAFDKIQVGKEKEMPFHAVIQALAPPPVTALASEAAGAAEPGPTGPPAPGSGGTTGGVNATGAPMARPSTPGNMGGNAGGDEGGGASMSRGNATTLSATSQGVIGMKNVQLSASKSGGAEASMLTSTNSNVKLESGTRLVLRLTAQ